MASGTNSDEVKLGDEFKNLLEDYMGQLCEEWKGKFEKIMAALGIRAP